MIGKAECFLGRKALPTTIDAEGPVPVALRALSDLLRHHSGKI